MNFPFEHVSFELGQLTLTINEQRITLFLVYRAPPSSKNKLTASLFFTELPDFLDFCLHCQNRIVISGDFNVHVDDAADSNAKKLLEQFEMYNLMQTVTEPTQMSGHILDLVVHRKNDDIILSTNVCHDLASDHYAILCHLSTPKLKCSPKFISTRSIGKVNHVKFAQDIAQFSTPNLPISEFNSNLSGIFDKHAPVRKIKIRDQKPSPWYTAISGQLRDAKSERRRAERQWKKSRLTVHKEIYDSAKRRVADLVDTAKTTFYSSLVSGSRTCKQLFQNMSRLLGKTKPVSLPSVSDIKILPNMFADFFCNKILTIRNCFPSTSQSRKTSPPFSGTPLSAFDPVTEDVVRKTIMQSTPKTCELDPMPTKFLFQHLDLLLPTITHIMNESLISGVCPTEFKTAILKPLLKKSNLDPNELKNYRPISNLPYLSKLLERLVLHQLFSHLTSHSLLSDHQSAYRPGHSTETVILRIANDLLNSLDQDKISVLLLLDLSAAFDTIDHDILLSRLNTTFGITNTALNWFRSYLSDRKQVVLVDGHRSSESTLNFGVPQGSVLGPVLFILYTTPLTHLIDTYSIRHEMYADDTQLVHSDTPPNYNHLIQSLQDSVTEVKNWMAENKLKLNDDKTEALRILPPSVDATSLPSTVDLGNTSVSFSDHVRDLGFFFDKEISMQHHIRKTCQVAYSELRRISSIRHYLTLDATKTLVSSSILSRLDYCNSLLIGCPQTLLRPLQQVQNSAAKLIYKAKRSTHCTPLLQELHWLPIEQRTKYKAACLCYHVITGTAPRYISDIFEIYTPSRYLRSSADDRIFRVPKYNRKKHGGRAFSSSAVQIWNSLPHHVRHSPSLPSFKSKLKTFLFQQHFF